MLKLHVLEYIAECNWPDENIWSFATANPDAHESNSTKRECTPMKMCLYQPDNGRHLHLAKYVPFRQIAMQLSYSTETRNWKVPQTRACLALEVTLATLHCSKRI